jgi:3-phosphoshikimate 1-carboxyvinyltransferase
MQQAIQPIKHPINASLNLPGSENLAYHALLLASLATGVSEISSIPSSENIHTFLTALGQLGIVVQRDEQTQSCIVAGGNGQFPKKQSTVWCGDAESAIHF